MGKVSDVVRDHRQLNDMEVERGIQVEVQRSLNGGWKLYVHVDGVTVLRTEPLESEKIQITDDRQGGA